MELPDGGGVHKQWTMTVGNRGQWRVRETECLGEGWSSELCVCVWVSLESVLIRVTSSNTSILKDSKRTLFYYNHILNYIYILRCLDKCPQNSPSADNNN